MTRVLTMAVLALGLTTPVVAQQAGWHHSHVAGEGDRAAMGCDRDATAERFTCLAVRCEDDFSVGLYVDTSRSPVLGLWEMTLDRENASLLAAGAAAPYGGRFVAEADWLLERLRQGTFAYLRHVDDADGDFAFISLDGSLQAIGAALFHCAPRLPADAG